MEKNTSVNTSVDTSVNVDAIINAAKINFSRDRKSVIRDYLSTHKDTVIASRVNKARGASIKLYALTADGTVKAYDYVVKNALVVVDALKHNGITVKEYTDGAIKDFAA